jgi:hypothetical protein
MRAAAGVVAEMEGELKGRKAKAPPVRPRRGRRVHRRVARQPKQARVQTSEPVVRTRAICGMRGRSNENNRGARNQEELRHVV